MTGVGQIEQVAAAQALEAKPRARWPWIAAGATVAALGAGYVGLAYALAGTMPTNLTVSGVPVGGLDFAAASQKVEAALAGRLQEPLALVVGSREAQLVPAEAGLGFDVPATLAPYDGLSFSPVVMWHRVTGGSAIDVETTVDAAALTSAVEQVADALTTAPTEGAISLAAAEVEVSPVKAGLAPDVPASVEALGANWMLSTRQELPGVAVAPQVAQEEIDRAAAEAKVVLGAAVTLQVEGQALQLPPEKLAEVVSYVPAEDKLVVQVDGEAISTHFAAQLAPLTVQPVDAKVQIENGAPRIVPAQDGKKVEAADIAAVVAKAVVSNQDRNAPVTPTVVSAKFSTADAEALGIKEKIADFSTPLTWETRRTQNIARGSELINGVIVPAGETFSLEQALGEVDSHTGFVDAGVILNGSHVDSMGGGLSQLATNVFNAGFLSGFVDVEHRPHTEYLSRYPEGREATLWTGHLDVKWKNDTPYAALIEAGVTDGEAWIRIWSTKYWKVDFTTSERYSYRAPTRVEVFTKPCEPHEAGAPGFSVTVTRTRSHGSVSETQEWETHYHAVNELVCK
ncbi:MAG: VanW family protein [Buchananella hordeovulneris]|nr:VanW family protein [Buchananella hordeovulneris]